FFQAEDGIRDGHVTGVQTCALPISGRITYRSCHHAHISKVKNSLVTCHVKCSVQSGIHPTFLKKPLIISIHPCGEKFIKTGALKIGRASCRERVEITEVGREMKRKI